MAKQTIHYAVMFCLVAALFVSCNSRRGDTSTKEAIAMIQAASQQRNYKRILTLADSLEKSGDLSLSDSYFWQGYAYYRLPQILTAEFYWKEAILATENRTDEASLMTYAKSASYLTNLLCRDADFSGALKVAIPVVSRLEKLNCDTNEHLLELLRTTHYDNSRQVIDTLATAVEQHRNGAEPNDDLTMMCIKL